MATLINPSWLIEHVQEFGSIVNDWPTHAKSLAADQALHHCEDIKVLESAMSDFFKGHSLKKLYAFNDPVSVKKAVWNYLEPYIVEQIEDEVIYV